jgi:hypothetical protein
MDAVTQVRHVEVQKEAEFVPCQPQIRQDLRAMNWKHDLDALDLDDQAVLDDVVNAEGRGKTDTVINNGQMHLMRESESRFRELMKQAHVVRAFEDAGSEHAVNPHRCTDDRMAGLIGAHALLSNFVFLRLIPLCPFVSFVPFVLKDATAVGQKQAGGHGLCL